MMARENIPGVNPETNRIINDIEAYLVQQLGALTLNGKPLSPHLCVITMLELSRRLVAGDRASSDLDGLVVIGRLSAEVARATQVRAQQLAQLITTPPDHMGST